MSSNTRSRDLKLFFLARALGAIYFWGAFSIPYLVYRGFSTLEAFSLVGIYSLLVVILEFPTGVIGDIYGHKFSTTVSYILGALNMLIIAQPLPKFAYYLLIFSAATSASLISGSDDALLKTISKDFKRDLAYSRYLYQIIAFACLSLAGTLAAINFTLPLYITAIAWLIGFLVIRNIAADSKTANTANIFTQAFDSSRTVFTNLTLLGVVIYASVNSGFAISIKTLINSFGTNNPGFELRYITYLVGFGFLTRAISSRFYHLLDHINNRTLLATVSLIFVALYLLPPSYLSLFILGILNGTSNIISLRASLHINSLIGDHIRASVLSLKNLLSRLFSSLYLFGTGILLSGNNFRLLMLFTLIIYLLAGLTFAKLKSNGSKNS